ncbi:MAG: TonB-dependent receptor plug domain-containing protein [Bacteroidales bacterium]|nr:TonB-dependent receptor plug domain-containing protein [Bacteroidales bacterium]
MLKIHKSTLLCTLLLGTAGASAQTQIDSEILSENPSYDITHALQDRVAGVDMQCVGTSPGDVLNVTIRGLRNISGENSPLLVINGAPSPLSLYDIDPTKIGSIQILKDAATAAIYGSLGKNGVILITTKSGRVNDRSQLSYNGYVGTKEKFGRYPMMSAKELMDYRMNLDYDPILSQEEQIGTDTDWQDLVFKSGSINNHNVNYSNGWKTGSVNAYMGYVKDNGILTQEECRRINMSIDVHQLIGSHILVGGYATYSDLDVTQNEIDLKEYIAHSPLCTPELEDKALSQDVRDYTIKSFNTRLFAELACPWVEGLKYRFDGNWHFYKEEESESTDNYTLSDYYKVTIKGDDDPKFHINHYQHQLWFERNFNDKHHLSLLGQLSTLKTSEEQDEYTYYVAYKDGLPLQSYTYPKSKETMSYHNMAYRIKYGYEDRYELTWTFSKDWRSMEETYDGETEKTLNKDSHKFSHSIHTQWNISNESFLNEAGWINNLSLRYDWGKICCPVYYKYYSSKLQATTERYMSSNWGLDFSLCNGRLSGSIDRYKQKNYNQHIMLNARVSSSAGVGSYYTPYNEAETQNKGWEFALQGVIIDHWNDWTWSMGVNMYANRNEITKIKENISDPIYEGYPINTPYRSEYEGLWQEGEQYPRWGAATPGTVKIKYDIERDENGDIRNIIEKRPVSMEPKMKGGFNSYVSWRNIDLNVVGAFQVGGQIYCNWYQEILGNGYLGNTIKVDYWTPENTDAHYPSPKTGTHYDAIGWYDASMYKIRTITLGYNVPKKWLDNIHVSKCRIYATVQNPWVFGSDFYKEFKMDPETNQANYAYGNYQEYNFPVIGIQAPSTRNYIVGVNLSF